jgi:hypothetical protein
VLAVLNLRIVLLTVVDYCHLECFRRLVWHMLTKVSEEYSAPLYLKMEAPDSSETLVNIRLHGVTSKETVIFVVSAMRTSYVTKNWLVNCHLHKCIFVLL